MMQGHWHREVRPRDVLSRVQRGFFNIFLQLLHISLELCSSVLEPAYHLKMGNYDVNKVWLDTVHGFYVLKFCKFVP